MRLFVDNLTNLDFSYLCPERGLVGETWLAHIELTGELDHQGMVCDFGLVKKSLRNWLDEHLDHRLVVPANSANALCKQLDGMVDIHFALNSGHYIHTASPAQAVTLLATDAIHPTNVAECCRQSLAGMFGSSIQQIRLSFTPESIDGPYYHYSHGLKKHGGNCQRIAHGHRSKILVWRNNQLCAETMAQWAQAFRDIYIATNADCVAKNDDVASFAYTSRQGEFQLTLPTQHCYFMDADTTVENIAQHLADTISAEHPGQQITVKAFEGLAKGAIADALTPRL
jgi:6-pyruvoyl-tetrahydropterin synthase